MFCGGGFLSCGAINVVIYTVSGSPVWGAEWMMFGVPFCTILYISNSTLWKMLACFVFGWSKKTHH